MNLTYLHPMEKKNWVQRWGHYAFDFLTVFTGITIAFLLNTWSEGRKDNHTETKILTEIKNGLKLDTADIQENIRGHKLGIEACNYFRDLANDKPVIDSLANQQFFLLLRDFISIQNKSGYESLKSRGLDLVQDDSLRLLIIAIHDFHFQILEKLEEDYAENQFYQNYFEPISKLLADCFIYNEEGQLIGFSQPVKFTATERKLFLTYLYKIEFNRRFMIRYYQQVDSAAMDLMKRIDTELSDR